MNEVYKRLEARNPLLVLEKCYHLTREREPPTVRRTNSRDKQTAMKHTTTVHGPGVTIGADFEPGLR